MPLRVTTAASTMPVSLDDAKVQCRIVDSDSTHDQRLTGLIWQAAASIESITGSRLSRSEVELVLDGFPVGAIDLTVYPVVAVDSVSYDDADGSAQTLAHATDYWRQLVGMYPKLCPIGEWPATQDGRPGCVRIAMTVGYESDDLPHDLKHAVLMRVSELFERSSESVMGSEVFETVNTVKALIGPHTRIRL